MRKESSQAFSPVQRHLKFSTLQKQLSPMSKQQSASYSTLHQVHLSLDNYSTNIGNGSKYIFEYIYIYVIYIKYRILLHIITCKILQTLLALSAFWLDEESHRSRHHITIQAKDLCAAAGWRMPKELVTMDSNPQQSVLGCRQYGPFCCRQSQRQKSISA